MQILPKISFADGKETKKMMYLWILYVALVIVWIIGTGLDIDVVGCLTGSIFGQILLFITGILYLMVGIKMFGTDKIGG